MNKLISTIVSAIILGIIYYLFTPILSDALFVTFGALIVLTLREIIVSYFNKWTKAQAPV